MPLMSKPPTGRNWAEQADWDYEHAKTTMLRDGYVMMTFVLHAPDGIGLLGVPQYDDAMRERLPLLLRTMCVAHGVVAIAHISEVWTLELEGSEGESEAELRARVARAGRPRDAAERVEKLLTRIEWREPDGTLGEAIRSGLVVRGSDGEPRAIVDDPQREIRTEHNHWAGLLPERAPDEAERKVAQVALEALAKTLGLDLQAIAMMPTGRETLH